MHRTQIACSHEVSFQLISCHPRRVIVTPHKAQYKTLHLTKRFTLVMRLVCKSLLEMPKTKNVLLLFYTFQCTGCNWMNSVCGGQNYTPPPLNYVTAAQTEPCSCGTADCERVQQQQLDFRGFNSAWLTGVGQKY